LILKTSAGESRGWNLNRGWVRDSPRQIIERASAEVKRCLASRVEKRLNGLVPVVELAAQSNDHHSCARRSQSMSHRLGSCTGNPEVLQEEYLGRTVGCEGWDVKSVCEELANIAAVRVHPTVDARQRRVGRREDSL
jgi:hypothetical protein